MSTPGFFETQARRLAGAREAERRVLARGWAIVEGDEVRYDSLVYECEAMAEAGFLATSEGAWYELFEDAERDGFRAVYVEVVTAEVPVEEKSE